MGLVLKFIEKLQTILMYVSAFFIIAVMLSISYEVMMRYFFSSPTRWVNDLSSYSLFVITFLAASSVLREEGHITIGLVIDSLSPRTQAFAKFVTSLICVVICGVFFWTSLKTWWEAYQRGFEFIGGITFSKHIILWFVPFGTFLLSVQFSIRAFRTFTADILGKGKT